MVKLIALLYLSLILGCAVSVNERFDLVEACEQDSEADCTAEWENYNKGLDAQERRERRALEDSICGGGFYLYCSHSCGMAKRRGEVAGVCVANPTNKLGSW